MVPGDGTFIKSPFRFTFFLFGFIEKNNDAISVYGILISLGILNTFGVNNLSHFAMTE